MADKAGPKDCIPSMRDRAPTRAHPINAPREWRELWAKRIKQLIDEYEPDHLYLDCAIAFRGEATDLLIRIGE